MEDNIIKIKPKKNDYLFIYNLSQIKVGLKSCRKLSAKLRNCAKLILKYIK